MSDYGVNDYGVRYADNSGTQVNGRVVSTPYENNKDVGVKVEDFLNLMVAQLQNQDFLNPVDDTQYVTQLAQFATMQAMQELGHYSQNSYALGMVGKTVTAASYGLNGVNKETGPVTKVSLVDGDYLITVNGKQFQMNQIMTISDGVVTSQDELDAAKEIPLITMGVTENSIDIRWEPPYKSEESESDLVYDVYYTTNGNIDFNDLQTVKKGTNAITGLKEPEYTINNLEPGKIYYVNVVVRNANGEESVYKRALIPTKGVEVKEEE